MAPQTSASRCWNSMPTAAAADDLELLSIKAAPYRYSSLKDLLPSTNALHVSDICIRNPLVKQAARAYLRPMSAAAPDSANIFRRLWRRVSGVIDFCRRVLDGTFRVVGIRSSG